MPRRYLPRRLKDLTLFIDKEPFQGLVKEFQPPTLTFKTEDYPAGGMDIAIKIELGMEPLEASLTLGSAEPKIMTTLGQLQGETAFRILGHIQSGASDAIKVEVTLNGGITETGSPEARGSQRCETHPVSLLLSMQRR